MTFHQLRIFEAVAGCLNITKASGTIRMSQPSVTKQLRLLENECGMKLYVKTGRGVVLTDAGRTLRVAAKPILEQMEVLRGQFAKGTIKDFVIGSTPSPASFCLPAVLKSFVKLHPTAHLILRTGYPEAIREMVLNGDVEIALTTIFPDHPDIVAELFYSEEVVAVVSTKHPLAKRGILDDCEFRQAPLVIMTVGRIVEEINKMGIKLNVVIRSESVDLGKEFVRGGLGIGLFYRGSAEAGLRDGSFKIIKIPRLKGIRIDCFIIYKKGTPLSGDGSNFLALLRKWPRKRQRAQYVPSKPKGKIVNLKIE